MSEAEEAVSAKTGPVEISARLDRLPGNPRLWGWIARLSLGGFFEVYDLALTAFLSPLLVKAGIFHKDASGLFGLPDQASFAFLTMFGLFVGALGFSGVADRYSRRSVFLGSMVWYAIATAIMGGQGTSVGVCLWRFVAGIGLGAELVVVDCYLAEITPKALRGRVFSISKFVQMCAVPTAGVLAHFFGPHEWMGVAGWRWMAFLPAGGALVVLAVRRGVPESPRWLAASGRIDQADSIVRNLEEHVVKRLGRPLPEPSPPHETLNAPVPKKTQYRELFRFPLRRRALMLIVGTSASSIVFYGFAHWVPTLLEAQGVTVTKSLLYSAMIGFSYPLSPLIASLFSDRLERKWQIALTGLLVVLFGQLFARQQSPPVWILLGVLLTLASEMNSTAVHTYRAELFPTHIRAKAIGFIYSFSRLSSALSNFIIGFMLLHTGVQGVFVFLALVMAVSITVITVWGPRTLGQSLDEIGMPTAYERAS
jgi:putative MFS transporter